MKLHHSFIAGLVAVGLVIGQEAAPATPPAPPADNANAAPAKPAPKKNFVKNVTGPVIAVDAAANIVIVKGRKGEDTLTVNDKTVIKAGEKAVTLADIKAGSKVKVQYKVVEGVKIASRISDIPAAPAGPKAKEETASPAAPATPAVPVAPAAPEAKKAETAPAAPACPATPAAPATTAQPAAPAAPATPATPATTPAPATK